MRKKRKAAVRVDAPRPSKPFAVVLSAAALAGGCAILFNAFFNQPDSVKAHLAASQGGNTNVTDVAEKPPNTITLKYDALVEDVQRELLATGHFRGLVDGVTGPQTAAAVEAYQRANKLDVTGEVSKNLLEHIQYTRKVNQAAEFTGSVEPKKKAVESQVKPLAALPKPIVEKAAAGDMAIDKAIVKVQQRLAALGYDPGSTSGELDEGTRSAILIFEMDRGLAMEGKISKALLSALKSAEAENKKP